VKITPCGVALYSPHPTCYIFLPYRHLMRQAAGPLTENLPNVCPVNDLAVLTDSFHRFAVKASRKRIPPSGNAESSLFARGVPGYGTTQART
jgi:hypothetical protein